MLDELHLGHLGLLNNVCISVDTFGAGSTHIVSDGIFPMTGVKVNVLLHSLQMYFRTSFITFYIFMKLLNYLHYK